MLTVAERENALIRAGITVASVMDFSAEQWQEVANTPGLHPAYRATILALAEFRHRLQDDKLSDLSDLVRISR